MKSSLLIVLVGALIAMSASADDNAGLNFRALLPNLPEASELPSLEPFEARDGTRLWYRHYPGRSSTALVLIHGSATDSKYLSLLASAVAESGVADVYTPDIRGHGSSPVRRGDIDYSVPGVQGEHGSLNEPRVYLEY